MEGDAAATPGITPEHEKNILIPRGLTAATAAAYGVRSIGSTEELVAAVPGFEGNRYAVGSGLLFRWTSPTEGVRWQFRPDSPVVNDSGDKVKYVFPAGSSMILNQLRDSGDGPLLIQEGTCQSLVAAVYAHPGWAVYGMSGCWSWRKGDTKVAIPDLMVVEGRDVVIGLDADAASNLAVYNAGMALKAQLQAESALSVRFYRLGGHGASVGLDDVLGQRPEAKRRTYLDRLLQTREEKPADTKPAAKKNGNAPVVPTGSGDRPVIIVNRDRRDVIDGITAALSNRWNGTELFNWGRILAQRVDAEVRPVTKPVFDDLIATAAQCVSVGSNGNATDSWPDDRSTGAALSRATQYAPLERIAQVPFVRTDGTICQTPGYDAESKTYLWLDPTFGKVDVPEQPTASEVSSAVKLLCDEWLGDLMAAMPDQADRANALGLVLTPLIRGLVPLAPLAAVDGLQPGVGKNLLADLVSIFAVGKPAAPLPYSRDDEENKKVITSSFRGGHDLLVFDEAHTIEGKSLNRAITSITYSDRILGVSDMVEYPNNVTWMALGNNINVLSDMARRVYRIRLAPPDANPEDRDVAGYRHPDIKGWTLAHRSELIVAALTLIRAWFASGKEQYAPGRRFASFEQWGSMVGGILTNAGIDGFLGNLLEWRSETDYETAHWTNHFRWLAEKFGTAEFTAGDVLTMMRRATNGTAEHPPGLENPEVPGYSRSLGMAYGRMRNRSLNGLRLRRVSTSVGHSNRWCVVSDEVPSSTASDEGSTDGGGNGSARLDHAIPARPPSPLHARNSSSIYVKYGRVFTGEGGEGYSQVQHGLAEAEADPLATLVTLCEEPPVKLCPECDEPEVITPSQLWFACRTCHPASFDRPENSV